MLAAIIVAAGSSRRVGFDKLTASIAGRTVMEHSLQAFVDSPSIQQIILVVRKEHVENFSNQLGQKEKAIKVVAGGAERQNSVEAGIAALNPAVSFVAVHDAARPLITPSQIESVYAAAREHGAASLAEPIADTPGALIPQVLSVNRWIANRSTRCRRRRFLRATRSAGSGLRRSGTSSTFVTDDVSAVELLGRRVALVEPNDYNFKVTYPRDLTLAELVLKQRLGNR